MHDLGMTIGQVAGQTGVSTHAIRYYEREGLVPKPDRTHTGYRIYGPEVLGRMPPRPPASSSTCPPWACRA